MFLERHHQPIAVSAGDKRKISHTYEQAKSQMDELSKEFSLMIDKSLIMERVEYAISNGVVAIDTETSSLNPLHNELVGFSIYTPPHKAFYVPLRHRDINTGEVVANQLSHSFAREVMLKLATVKEIIMHNADFDCRTIKHNLGVDIHATWDTAIAMRLLNENEKSNNLKDLYDKYVAKSGKVQKYTDLFGGMGFSYVPIEVGYPYAAKDPYMTYMLQQFQKQFLDGKLTDKYKLDKIYKVFREIEMPLNAVVRDMEDLGTEYDADVGAQLLNTYEEQLKVAVERFNKAVEPYEGLIREYQIDYELRKKAGGNVKYQRLDYPVMHSSPYQVAILLYDVMKLPTGKRKKGKERSTDKKNIIGYNNDVVKALLDISKISKILTTYVRKFPELAAYDGRIHTNYKQLGTDTGRFSSNDVNLQNQPKIVRPAFKATDGYKLISVDYSGQEVRVATHLAQDAKMIQAYKDGKDVYVEIASLVFNKPYEECLESYGEEGYKRRWTAKQLVLSLLYGKQEYTVAQDLNVTTKEAKEVFTKLFNSFSGLDKWIQEVKTQAYRDGFVTTMDGTRRRLPDLKLPKYQFAPIRDNTITSEQQQRYTKLMDKAWGKKGKEEVIAKARRELIHIEDNTWKIARAERQCVNAVVQGSSAYMIKKAMLRIASDPLLKKLGYRMLITIHDEILGEAPTENAVEAGQRVSELMVSVTEGMLVPFKCDVDIWDNWASKEDDEDLPTTHDDEDDEDTTEEL